MSSDRFYSIIDYSAPTPEQVPRIAASFMEIQERWVSPYPGFLSARFLANTDGSSVRAIVEWESEQALLDFEKVSDTKGRLVALQEAFDRHSTQGTRQTFRTIGTVRPREMQR